jgi:hypothetical protein
MSAPLLNSVSERQRLEKRASYFFATSARARSEVSAFAADLQNVGPIVVIGGFLRDVFLVGNREFTSDIDFVADPISIKEFDRFATRLGARLNRFGGCRIELKRWKVDVWPRERTWAAVHGHISLSCLHDLVNATFFDWDAVLYDLSTRRVITQQGYFERVCRRIIDINLEPNPNPIGNAVRAVRYAYRWDAALGNRLVEHVAKQIRDCGWHGLIATENRSFANPVLKAFDGDLVTAALQDSERHGNGPVHLPLRAVQQELPLRT